MEPEAGETAAFWSQPSTAVLHSASRRRSPLLNPVALIIAVPIVILLILFLILPTFLSHTNQILRSNSVKRGWDTLNVVLVLFAVLCGVFARRNDDVSTSDASVVPSFVNRPRRSVTSWLDFPDQREYDEISSSVNRAAVGGGLRRSSTSYPDLREESMWPSGGGNIRSRFFDDFEVNFHRSPPPGSLRSRGRRSRAAERVEAETVVEEIPVDKVEISSAPPARSRGRRSRAAEIEEAETVVKEIPVDIVEISSAPPPPTPPRLPAPQPPPPPTTATANLKRRRSSRSVPRKQKAEKPKIEAESSENQQPAPPPPPPPEIIERNPPPPEIKTEKNRRKNNTTSTKKEIATAITAIYKGTHKKKVKSREIYENAPQNSSPPSLQPQATPPPPPPPPPPSKVLQNLFKKASKSAKRIHSVPTTAPPPPPPPPPSSIFNNIFKSGTKSKRFQLQQSSTAPPPPPPPSSILNSIFTTGSKSLRFKNVITTPPPAPPPPPSPPRRRQINIGKPPKPTKPSAQYHESVFIAPASPLIPPPPPPPPFRMPETKFVTQGDFVRILSANSSRCSSPELEDDDGVSVKSEIGDSSGPSVTCPSPDVNVKADTFIARLRDEWKLEKMNSFKENRNLG